MAFVGPARRWLSPHPNWVSPGSRGACCPSSHVTSCSPLQFPDRVLSLQRALCPGLWDQHVPGHRPQDGHHARGVRQAGPGAPGALAGESRVRAASGPDLPVPTDQQRRPSVGPRPQTRRGSGHTWGAGRLRLGTRDPLSTGKKARGPKQGREGQRAQRQEAAMATTVLAGTAPLGPRFGQGVPDPSGNRVASRTGQVPSGGGLWLQACRRPAASRPPGRGGAPVDPAGQRGFRGARGRAGRAWSTSPRGWASLACPGPSPPRVATARRVR